LGLVDSVDQAPRAVLAWLSFSVFSPSRINAIASCRFNSKKETLRRLNGPWLAGCDPNKDEPCGDKNARFGERT